MEAANQRRKLPVFGEARERRPHTNGGVWWIQEHTQALLGQQGDIFTGQNIQRQVDSLPEGNDSMVLPEVDQEAGEV